MLACEPNPRVSKSYLYSVDIDSWEGILSAIVDSRVTNDFVHNKVIQQLHVMTMDIPAMRVILADASNVNDSNATPHYLNPGENLQ